MARGGVGWAGRAAGPVEALAAHFEAHAGEILVVQRYGMPVQRDNTFLQRYGMSVQRYDITCGSLGVSHSWQRHNIFVQL